MPSSIEDIDRGGSQRLFCGKDYIDKAGFSLIKDYGSQENIEECTLIIGE